MMEKLLICGSRTLVGPDPTYRMRKMLDGIWMSHEGLTTVIAGGARGADSIGAGWARGAGLEVIEIAAQWDRFGRSAGFKRNLEMLDLAPDLVVAFVDKPLVDSVGTAHTVREAQAREIETRVFRLSTQMGGE